MAANSVRKICTKIGNGQQYHLLGSATRPSAAAAAYGGGHSVPVDAIVQPQHPTRTEVEKTRKFACAVTANHAFPRLSPQPVYLASRPVPPNDGRAAAAVRWFRGRDVCLAAAADNRENTTVGSAAASCLNAVDAGSDGPLKSPSGSADCSPDPKGLPSAEQLNYIHDKLGEDLPLMFRQTLNYGLYHPKLVFENNIRGTKSVGLEYFMSTMSILRLLGHLKYAFVKFDILKITKHPEEGTVKIRWRIKGISGMKVFMKFWKFRLWNLEQVIQENVETWHDGFSIFVVGSDGLIHKLTADKMQPNNDPVVEDKNSLAAKLALFAGLTPQLNNLDCLVTFDSEQTNELLKMVMMSLEDVI